MTLWMTRDIRIYPLETSAARLRTWAREATASTAGRGTRAPTQEEDVASALWCVGLSGEFKSRTPNAREWTILSMKPSADRTLVEEAVVHGCHVFLTRDRKILQRRADLTLGGIAAMRPTHLLDALSDSGETEQPLGADGMICDNQQADAPRGSDSRGPDSSLMLQRSSPLSSGQARP